MRACSDPRQLPFSDKNDTTGLPLQGQRVVELLGQVLLQIPAFLSGTTGISRVNTHIISYHALKKRVLAWVARPIHHGVAQP